jgi:SAM-dependent methyltransferase
VLANYAKNGAAVTGVEISTTALRLARERFRITALPASLVQGDGATVPLRSASFDIACAMGVLHHIPDPTPVVRELYRVLKPGGRLIVMVYHRWSFRRQVYFRWARRWGLPRDRGRTLDELVRRNDGSDRGNPCGRVYSRTELRALLGQFAEHEFIVGQLSSQELAFHNRWLIPVVSRVIPARFVSSVLAAYVGWNLYCLAKKPHREEA